MVFINGYEQHSRMWSGNFWDDRRRERKVMKEEMKRKEEIGNVVPMNSL